MTGFASLSLAEWSSSGLANKEIQYHECKEWLEKSLDGATEKERRAEWKLIRSTVSQETLIDAINTSELDFKGVQLPQEMKVRKNVKKREQEVIEMTALIDEWQEKSQPFLLWNMSPMEYERSIEFLHEFQDVVQWNKIWKCFNRYRQEGDYSVTVIGNWSWLTFLLHAEWPSEAIEKVAKMAEGHGWKWTAAGVEDYEWMFYLNTVSDVYYYRANPGEIVSSERYLLQKLKDNAPETLQVKFDEFGKDSLFDHLNLSGVLEKPAMWSPFTYCILYGLMAADPRGDGFLFWSENVNLYSRAERDWALSLMVNHNKTPDPAQQLCHAAINTLINALEVYKMKEDLSQEHGDITVPSAIVSAL